MNKILKIYIVQLNRTYYCANLRICKDSATPGLSTIIENMIVKCAKILTQSDIHQKHVTYSYVIFFKYLVWSLNLVASGLLSFQYS